MTGQPHRPSREEVLLVLDGEISIRLDGTATRARTGDVVPVPAGSEFQIDGGDAPATAWVTTTQGLTATLADGSVLSPPWAQ